MFLINWQWRPRAQARQAVPELTCRQKISGTFAKPTMSNGRVFSQPASSTSYFFCHVDKQAVTSKVQQQAQHTIARSKPGPPYTSNVKPTADLKEVSSVCASLLAQSMRMIRLVWNSALGPPAAKCHQADGSLHGGAAGLEVRGTTSKFANLVLTAPWR